MKMSMLFGVYSHSRLYSEIRELFHDQTNDMMTGGGFMDEHILLSNHFLSHLFLIILGYPLSGRKQSKAFIPGAGGTGWHATC